MIIVEIDISSCVHYCGFRYGHGDYNPYETYLVGLHRGSAPEMLRGEFVDFLRHYRPRHFAEALGRPLKREYPLWRYPWQRLPWLPRRSSAWRSDFGQIPDILTHFSPRGVSRERVQEEFRWLERAYQAINAQGYRPNEFGYAVVQRLVHTDGRFAHLLIDGNHRVGAMSAIGQKTFLAKMSDHQTVRAADCPRWPGVRRRRFDQDDARMIFSAYFDGNHNYRTTTVAAEMCD